MVCHSILQDSCSKVFQFEFWPFLFWLLLKRSDLQACIYRPLCRKHSHISDHDGEFVFHEELWDLWPFESWIAKFRLNWKMFCWVYARWFSFGCLRRLRVPWQCIKFGFFHQRKLPYNWRYWDGKWKQGFWFNWVHFPFLFISFVRFWPGITWGDTFFIAYMLPSSNRWTL